MLSFKETKYHIIGSFEESKYEWASEPYLVSEILWHILPELVGWLSQFVQVSLQVEMKIADVVFKVFIRAYVQLQKMNNSQIQGGDSRTWVYEEHHCSVFYYYYYQQIL